MGDELDDGAADAGDGVDGEEEDGKHRRVPLPVKVVVIGGLWVLLVVFLAGVFSSEDDGTVELDQANGTNVQLDSIAGDDEASEDEGDDDSDDSSTIEEGDARALTRGGSTASGSAGATSGGSSSGSGSSSGGTGGTGGTGGGSETTSPDEQPAAGGGGSSSSTTAPKSTTSTTKKPTTSSSTTTTTTTSTTQPPAYAKTVELDRDDSDPEFSPSSITIKKGQAVRFLNKDGTHTHTLHFGDNDEVAVLTPNDSKVRQFNTVGTFTVNCTTPGHHGNLSVKVEA